MKREEPRNKGRRLARETLRQAPGSVKPDLTRILESVPELLAQARRRRATGPPAPLVAGTWRAIPKLAAVTAGAVVLASIALLVESRIATASPAGVDSAILETDDGSSGDALLDALVAMDQDGG